MRRKRRQAHDKAVCAIAVHESSQRLVSGGADGSVRLYSLPKLELVRALEGFGEAPSALGFGSPEAHEILALGTSGSVAAWSSNKSEPLFQGRADVLSGDVAAAAFYPKTACFALAQQSPFARGEPLSRQSLLHRDPLKVHPKGELVALYSAPEQSFSHRFLWKLEEDTCTERITHSIQFMPNGQSVVLAGIEATFDPAGDWIGYGRHLLLWKPEERRLLAALSLDRDVMPPWNVHQCIAVDPSGSFIAVSALSEAHVREQDYALGERAVYSLSQFQKPNLAVNSIEFNPPEPFSHLGSLESMPSAMAFSPDGFLLAMAGGDGVCAAEWRRGAEGYLGGVDAEDDATQVLFTPNGKHLVCGYKDGSLEIFRL